MPSVLIVSGLCPLLYYALTDDQTEGVRSKERDRRFSMVPVKRRISEDFSVEQKTVKQPRVSSPKPSVKSHMPLKGDGCEQWRKREEDPSAVPKSCDLQVAPPHENKRGQKRSRRCSSVSDDSLSPHPVKVNHRGTY